MDISPTPTHVFQSDIIFSLARTQTKRERIFTDAITVRFLSHLWKCTITDNGTMDLFLAAWHMATKGTKLIS
jgi:hypothetical protein